MKIVRVTKGFCNAYIVIENERGIIVDTLYPGNGKFILDKIREIGIYSFEPEAIFITHAHFDHAGSAKFLADFFHIPVISHRLAKTYLEKGENAPISPYGIKGKMILFGAKLIGGKYPSVSPDIIFDDVLDLSEFGIDAYLTHTPGHTDGSSSLRTKDEDVILGDLLMGIPFPFLPSYPISITSFPLLTKSVENLIFHGAKRFYPGHGNPWEVEKVKKIIKKLEGKKVAFAS